MINEKVDGNFKKQVTDLEVVIINEPRVYLRWTNTEKGRDKTDCYERINDVYVRYVNTHNRSQSIIKGDKIFNTLEEMYTESINNLK